MLIHFSLRSFAPLMRTALQNENTIEKIDDVESIAHERVTATGAD